MILVTGGAGFIGSHLVRRLIGLGHKVALLVKDSTHLLRIQDIVPHVSLHTGDMSDHRKLQKIVEEIQPAGVYHLAASNIQSGVTAGDDDVIRTNFLGTVNLLKALETHPYQFFVHSGSFLEYGPKRHPLKETDLPEPREVYSISKLSATLAVEAAGMASGKPAITLRTFTPYGPSMQHGRLVYELVTRALRSEVISLTDPNVTRDFIFVEDLVDLYIECMEKAKAYPGQIFNAGSGRATTLGEVAEYVLKKTVSKSTIQWGTFRTVSYDSDRWQADMEKTFASFSWRPRHTLDAGLDETIHWFQEQYSFL